jgi:hypothetical protein
MVRTSHLKKPLQQAQQAIRVMKRIFKISALCLALACSLCSADPAPPVVSPTPTAVTLAAGTPIVLVLDKTIKSNGTGEGDPVMLHTSAPIYSSDNSHTLFIAQNAIAMGHVIVSSKRGYAGRRGSLEFQIDYVMSVINKRVYLSDQCIGGTATDRGAISIATTLVFGDVGLLIQGGDKKFPAGTKVTVYVDQDASM